MQPSCLPRLRPQLLLLPSLISVFGVLAARGSLSALPQDYEPFLVHDIQRTPLHEGMVASGRYFVGGLEVDGVLYFAARDRAHGNELWRTDGTEAGTWLVDDLCPGPCPSDPWPRAAVGDRLLFNAHDGVHGDELWSTEGGRGDAVLIHESVPGPDPGHSHLLAELTALGDAVYFQDGRELWRTDGTHRGTRLAVELPGTTHVRDFTRVGDHLYFRASTEDDDHEIWRTDGSPEGTSTVTDLCSAPCSSIPQGLLALGDRLLFATGREVWALDTATGRTVLLTTLQDPPGLGAVSWNGRAYFPDGSRLLETDGTPEGTAEVARIEPRTTLTPLPRALLLESGRALASFDGQVVTHLETFDGELFPTGVDSPLTLAGDRAFFRVTEPVDGYDEGTRVAEVWVSDGTPEGTRKVVDLCGGVVSCLDGAQGGDPRGAASLGELYLFVVDSIETGNEAWVSDGTAAGTHLLTDLWVDPGSADPDPLPYAGTAGRRHAPLAAGERLVFPALDSTVANERWLSEYRLWTTTPGGGAIPVGPAEGRVGGLSLLGGAVLLDQGFELWRFDAETGAFEVLSEEAAPGGPSIVHRDRLFFARGGCSDELWVSDGSAGGTRLLGEFQGGDCVVVPWLQAIPGPMVELGNEVAFHALGDYGAANGLWVADPAEDVRFLASVSIHPGRRYPDSSSMASTDRRVLFTGSGFSGERPLGRELWGSDGTVGGTGPLVDLRPGAEDSEPHDLTRFGGLVAFLAAPRGIERGESLWLSDGTAGGTERVSGLGMDSGPSWATHLTAVGDRLFFVATNEATGPELWTSDGTAAGTRRVTDLRPGPRGSYPRGLTGVGDLLVFAADDGVTGLEAWVSDGTASGTRRLFDLAPGRLASSPSDFTRAGDLLYFWADEPVHGRELRALPVEALESAGPGGGVPPLPPGEWLASAELPGFRAKVRVIPAGHGPIEGRRAENCIAETLCVEGALEGRPEAFLKVIGPRPNGRLWVQVSRFTPSAVELWVEQTATGELRHYHLPAVGPGDPDVSGLQDREAFTP